MAKRGYFAFKNKKMVAYLFLFLLSFFSLSLPSLGHQQVASPPVGPPTAFIGHHLGRSAPWKHALEGPDDMPAHIKSSMFGCALTIPITNGKLNMGTWQGKWLCEHRDHPTARKVVVTLNGI